MIKHVLLFKLREMESAQEKQAVMEEIKRRLESLTAVVPSIKSMEVGLNQNPREQFDIALITTHDDWDGLYAYRDHPAHVEVAQFIAQHRESRSCADFEC